jgi:hypothetical protein
MSTQTSQFKDETLNRIVLFLHEIGIGVVPATLSEETFLPGTKISGGKIWVDESKLLSPGDVLHEAGHLAVVPSNERATLAESDAISNPGNEMAAIAWSWAALKHLDISPDIVFHIRGYKGGADSIIDNFSNNRYFGVPVLQYRGLCFEPRLAAENGQQPFPYMLKWTAE